VEYSPFGLCEGMSTSVALVTLFPFTGLAELANVTVVDLALIWTGLIPTEGIRRYQLILTHFAPPSLRLGVIIPQIIYQRKYGRLPKFLI